VKLTIDSAESLDNVLRTVGALFGVELEARGEAARPAKAAPARRRLASAATSTRRRGGAARTGTRRPAAASRTASSTSDVRSWARANGYDVSDRGRISETVLSAYRAATN